MIGIVAAIVNHYQLLLLLPIVLAFKVETEYVSRVATLTNTVSMFVAIAPFWDQTRPWFEVSGISLFHLYLGIGLVVGVIAMISYLVEQSPGSSFYWVTFSFYNSAIAGVVCLVAASMTVQNASLIPFG